MFDAGTLNAGAKPLLVMHNKKENKHD